MRKKTNKKGKQKVQLWIDHHGDYEKDNKDSETLKCMLVTRMMILVVEIMIRVMIMIFVKILMVFDEDNSDPGGE